MSMTAFSDKAQSPRRLSDLARAKPSNRSASSCFLRQFAHFFASICFSCCDRIKFSAAKIDIILESTKYF